MSNDGKLRTHLIRTVNSNSLGSLSFFEGEKDIPFDIKRIYYIYNVPRNGKRGEHAHKGLKQFLWCPYGKIKIIVDNGFKKEEILLDSPNKGLFIGKGIWHDMIWLTENAVLCVAASDYYDESDYIRDYDEFLKLVKKGYWK